jgi:hypothetical protein
MLGRLCGLTGDTVGCTRDVFLGSSLGAFAHKIGELGTGGCCTQMIYVLVRNSEGAGCGSVAPNDESQGPRACQAS